MQRREDLLERLVHILSKRKKLKRKGPVMDHEIINKKAARPRKETPSRLELGPVRGKPTEMIDFVSLKGRLRDVEFICEGGEVLTFSIFMIQCGVSKVLRRIVYEALNKPATLETISEYYWHSLFSCVQLTTIGRLIRSAFWLK